MEQFKPIEVTQTEVDTIIKRVKIFITGTAAYGPFTENSDIDIVVMQKTGDAIEFLLNAIGILTFPINDKYENPSFFFHINGTRRTIQIVTIHNQRQFVGWYKATEGMKKMEPIIDRSDRVNMFQQLSKIRVMSDIEEVKE